MIGRMSDLENNIFYTCSLIDYIGRITKNHRKDVVNLLGEKRIGKIFDLADIYHSDNMERVANDFIEDANINIGSFDNVKACKYSLPTCFDLGKTYGRVVKLLMDEEKIDVIEAIFKVYNSFISEKIDNYNSSFYYETAHNILIYYYDGMPYDQSVGAKFNSK